MESYILDMEIFLLKMYKGKIVIGGTEENIYYLKKLSVIRRKKVN